MILKLPRLMNMAKRTTGMVDKKRPKTTKKTSPKKTAAKKKPAATKGSPTISRSSSQKAKSKTSSAKSKPVKNEQSVWRRIRNTVFPFMNVSAAPKKKTSSAAKPSQKKQKERSSFARNMRYPFALVPALIVLWVTDALSFPMPMPIFFAIVTYGLVCLLGIVRSASIGITLGVAVMAVLAYFAYDMPGIDNLDKPRTNPGIVVLASNGKQIARYGDIYGDYLTYEEFPPHLVEAVTSTEDRNFFQHHGIDPKGILRAMFVNMKEGGVVQGGSTITQQLAKNVFLTSERTFSRKVQEMLLSFWLESHFSKEEIMAIYLNRVYLGAGNYGVDAASHDYFGKSAKDLNISEAAVIAGLLKAPSRYSPNNSKDRATDRARQVLVNMVNAKKMTERQREDAVKNIIYPENGGVPTMHASARYFSDWVVNQLPEYIGTVDKDIVIKTTLDPVMQKYAQRAADRVLTDKVRESRNVSQVSLVSMRPNGAVVSMIGGRNYDESQYNRATQAMRQPASAFKLFVYLAAMENGYFPESEVTDKEVTYGKWKPKNYNKRFRGKTNVETALRYSINSVAVQLGSKVGISNVIKTARRLGVKSKLGKDLSLALGSSEVNVLEMATAYAHLASNGKAVQPYFIKSITTRKDDEVLYKHKKSSETTVIEEDVVAKMNKMLIGVVADGTGKAARLKVEAAGKTGTTSDYKDAWFAGYTGRLSTVVWVGNDNATKMKKVTGGDLPAIIWRDFMQPAQSSYKFAKLETEYKKKETDLPWLSGTVVASDPNAAHSPGQLGASFWGKLLDGDKKPNFAQPTKSSDKGSEKKTIVKGDDAFKPIPQKLKKKTLSKRSSGKPQPIYEVKGNIEVSEDKETEYVYPGDRRRRIRR